ncbi:hypothetical protein [Ligaoa zhengdingensis]|uniref:hypothetical protein n=1 Tax=Ligaoa zhengdingensis TaxID=2763658 RepID=UPI0031BAD07C
MSFPISLIDGEPVWDSLPVAKIIDYPLEKRDYKPFAQARLCISPESVWVRLWAFEVTPSAGSTLAVSLDLRPSSAPGAYLFLSASHSGELATEVVTEARRTPMAEYLILPRVKSFVSEDLQGIYWGVVFELPRLLLPKVYGTDELTAGMTVRGNLFKFDREPGSEHYGSFYPVDFHAPDPFGERFFGDFDLVAY